MADEGSPLPAEEAAPAGDAAPVEAAPVEAAPAEAPPAAGGEPPPAADAVAPKKSTSFSVDKKLSRSQSRTGSRRQSEADRRDSKKLSDAKRFGSVTEEPSKEMLMRRRSDRPSKARLALGSVISLKRGSIAGEYFDRAKAPRYMNSYKLDSDKPFVIERVERILETVLTETMEDMSYDPDKCMKQAKWACSAIRAKVKEQEYDRYKLVIMVTIGEKLSQDFLSTCRFLWDYERDKYAKFSYENMHVFGTALCFGIYYE